VQKFGWSDQRGGGGKGSENTIEDVLREDAKDAKNSRGIHHRGLRGHREDKVEFNLDFFGFPLCSSVSSSEAQRAVVNLDSSRFFASSR